MLKDKSSSLLIASSNSIALKVVKLVKVEIGENNVKNIFVTS